MIKTEDLVPGDRCLVRTRGAKFLGKLLESEAIFIQVDEALSGGRFLFEGCGTDFVFDTEILSIVKKFERK